MRRHIENVLERILRIHQYLAIVLVVLIGLMLSSIAFVRTQIVESLEARADFVKVAENHFAAVEQEIDRNWLALISLRAFFNSSVDVTRFEFQNFVQPFLREHSSLRTLAWAPRVRASERAAYEKKAKIDGFDNFQFTEPDAVGNYVAATARNEYFPIYFVEPYAGNETQLGFDMALDNHQAAALAKALDSGEAVATERIALNLASGNQFGVLIILPVYRHGTLTDTPEARRENLAGVLIGVLQVDDLVEKSLDGLDPNEAELVLFDQTAPREAQLLYHYLPATGNARTEPRALFEYTDLSYTKMMPVAGRNWSIEVNAPPDYVARRQTWQPWFMLGGSLALTIILVGYMINSVRYTQRTEQLASALTTTNQQLSKELVEHQRAQAALSESEARYRALYNAVTDALYVHELGQDGSVGHFIEVNDVACQMLGYTRAEFLQLSPAEIAVPDADPEVERIVTDLLAGQSMTFQQMHVAKDGHRVPVEIHARAFELDGHTVTISLVRDITQRKQAEESLRYLSTHDVLTGLYNRAFFQEEQQRLERSRQFPVSVMMADIDGLKETNDHLGHAAGDELLRRMATVLKAAFRAEDVVARIGGDEFAALLPCTDTDAAQETVTRLRAQLVSHNALFPDWPLRVSLGVATADLTQNLDGTLKQADARMYQDKLTRKNSA